MPISKDHHDLFHGSSTLDKINLFQTLLDSKDLTSMEALALLTISVTPMPNERRRWSSFGWRRRGVRPLA